MNTISIVLLIIVSTVVLFLIGYLIYKKINHSPIGECESCINKGKKLVDDYYKAYPKEKDKRRVDK